MNNELPAAGTAFAPIHPLKADDLVERGGSCMWMGAPCGRIFPPPVPQAPGCFFLLELRSLPQILSQNGRKHPKKKINTYDAAALQFQQANRFI
jgi:hypothetical protein